MKITIENNKERQTAKVVIDTESCHYPYAIREAIELALKLDGHDEETINEIFGRSPNKVCKEKEEISEELHSIANEDSIFNKEAGEKDINTTGDYVAIDFSKNKRVDYFHTEDAALHHVITLGEEHWAVTTRSRWAEFCNLAELVGGLDPRLFLGLEDNIKTSFEGLCEE